MAFTLYHADQMPQVRVQSIDVADLGSGLMQITAAVTNQRLIPTHLAVDLERRITRPDEVSLAGEGFSVLASCYSQSQFFEYPTAQRRHPQTVEVPSIGGMDTIYVRWLTSGMLPAAVEVSSIKGGSDSMSLDAGK